MKRCVSGDLSRILNFYQLVINETENMSVHARWVYGQHPTEEMITNYVNQGHMYCSEDGNDIAVDVFDGYPISSLFCKLCVFGLPINRVQQITEFQL